MVRSSELVARTKLKIGSIRSLLSRQYLIRSSVPWISNGIPGIMDGIHRDQEQCALKQEWYTWDHGWYTH